MNATAVREQILAVIANPRDERSISALVKTCLRLAKTTIIRNHAKYTYPATQAGLSFDDLAFRAVTDLFIPRFHQPCYELVHFFEEGVEYESGEESLISLRKLVYKKVVQTVSEIIGESSPESKRILRNIRDVLRSGPTWNSRELFNDVVYFRLPEDQAMLHKPAIPVEDILPLFLADSKNRDTVLDLIEIAFSMVEAQSEYRRGWSVMELLALLREKYLTLNFLEFNSTSTTPPDVLDFEIQERIEATLSHLRQTILLKYQNSGKLVNGDSAHFEAAARCMLSDLVQNQTGKLYDYYHDQYQELDYEDYRNNGRAQFEYYMRIAREDFWDRFRDFGEK